MHDHHPSISIGAPLLAAFSFLSMGFHNLVASGLTWQSAAALLAGVGSCLIGGAAVSREVRSWYDGLREAAAREREAHERHLDRLAAEGRIDAGKLAALREP